ncbi:hypothetical protein AXG93_4343s1610 [Marchantia polymorpha subsp. ruderalis]|uniref:Uncharacterized protein n=1 Tax=Marchantia polymorpha subsp. ruderalis TaxID=1480154 RepID=A0A176VVJ3_MARPO|nr:hypothetical protein AXG93_4343s1610 [Marchantia polymorpha subsp. ruderalis]
MVDCHGLRSPSDPHDGAAGDEVAGARAEGRAGSFGGKLSGIKELRVDCSSMTLLGSTLSCKPLTRLSKNFQNIPKVDASHALESTLERRWLKMLQPITVLAYVLHPMLQLNHINRMEPIAQPHKLCQLAGDLYTEYFGETIEDMNDVIRHTKSRNRFDSSKAVKIAKIQAAMHSRVAIQEATTQAKPRGTNAPQREFQRQFLPAALGATSSLSIPTPNASQQIGASRLNDKTEWTLSGFANAQLDETIVDLPDLVVANDQWANLLENWFNEIKEEEYDAEDLLEYGIGQAPHQTIIKQCLL